ncbi:MULTISPECIES: hypothetical protein [Pseudomonas syringae group]|uniref:hypothetical protein n=1 Tax=Pseudomonas syringae group TaxID=136849 RepID=UPI00073092D4|nr:MULTISPECIES: hypothetical protein [Pseudomonas syringae group]KTC07950.1 hypothetical protein AO387_10580 [Pseudomonas syringae ICMP 11168]SFJ16528.1 hypothetical protein SAMN05444507_11728 [Pseudomonas syringae]
MTEIPRVPGRAYQVTRDPERLLIEERAEALSLLGYPLVLDDNTAMHAEQRLKEAKEAARSAQVGGIYEHSSTEKGVRGT